MNERREITVRPSLDQLVGSHEERSRQCEIESPGGLQIDDEIELDGLLDRKIAGLRAFQNFVHVAGGAPEQSGSFGVYASNPSASACSRYVYADGSRAFSAN